MNDMKECMKLFLRWVRKNRFKQKQLKSLEEKYNFYRNRWMSIGGISYDLERVQGGSNKDPHLEAFYKMVETEEKIKKVQLELKSFYSFRDSLTEKQILFFNQVLIDGYSISKFCKLNDVSLSRGYELKQLICLKWHKKRFLLT